MYSVAAARVVEAGTQFNVAVFWPRSDGADFLNLCNKLGLNPVNWTLWCKFYDLLLTRHVFTSFQQQLTEWLCQSPFVLTRKTPKTTIGSDECAQPIPPRYKSRFVHDRFRVCEHGPTSNRCIKYLSNVLFSDGISFAYFLLFHNNDRQQKAQTFSLALISSRHTCHRIFQRSYVNALLFAIDLSACVIIVSDASEYMLSAALLRLKLWCCAFQAAQS